MLDLLSNGRCEFGMGESASITELEPFGRSMEDKRAVFEEAVRRSSRCSRTAAASITASISTCRLRNVLPKPLQKPHPPIWMACSQLDTIERAGPLRHGRARLPVRQRRRRARLGARLLQRHHQAAEEARRLHHQSQHRAGQLLHVLQDRRGGEEARRRLPRSSSSRCASTARPPTASGRRPARSTCGTSTTSGSAPTRTRRRRRCRGGLIGSPDTLRRKLAKFETSHIDQVILLNQAGKNAHEDICESLELFGKEVMPEFQGHHAAHEAWKAKVMRREIELEEIETAAFKDRYGAKAMPAQVRVPKARDGLICRFRGQTPRLYGFDQIATCTRGV